MIDPAGNRLDYADRLRLGTPAEQQVLIEVGITTGSA